MPRPNSPFISLHAFWDQRAEWGRFIKILFALALAPLCFIVVIIVLSFLRSDAAVSPKEAARRQQANPRMLFLPASEKEVASFKLDRYALLQPEVLSLGASRGTELRASMFAPYSYYNLSEDGMSIRSQLRIAQRLLEIHVPRVVFLNVDFFTFSAGYTQSVSKFDPRLNEGGWRELPFLAYHAYVVGSAHPAELFKSHYGIPGQASLGFYDPASVWAIRSDGSLTLAPRNQEIAGKNPFGLARAESGENFLHRADQMSSGELDTFRQLVQLLKSKGATVIAFQAPIYQPMLQEIRQSRHYGILDDFNQRAVQQEFPTLGLIYFDFLDFPPYSSDYSNFIDPFHPTEVLDAAMVAQMAQDPRVRALLPKLDPAAIKSQLDKDSQAREHLYLYPE